MIARFSPDGENSHQPEQYVQLAAQELTNEELLLFTRIRRKIECIERKSGNLSDGIARRTDSAEE
jgi:hypothetical protein